MTHDRGPSFDNVYDTLRANYVTRLHKSAALLDALLELKRTGHIFKKDAVEAHRLAHMLAGSGATFGFPNISEVAILAEEFLSKYLKAAPDGSVMSIVDAEIFESLIMNLRTICAKISDFEQAQDNLSGKKATNTVHAGFSGQERGPEYASDSFHVLIVDDDPDLPALMSAALHEKNIIATYSPDGMDALKSILLQKPDLIVLDIMMPGLSGHEVLVRLKKDPSMMDIPIIMLSQSTQDHDLVNSIRSGAIDYIHKPFRPEDLVGRIEGILQAAGRTVVIADNDPMIVHLLKSKFEFEGYRVVTAGDGQKALDLIAKYKPDLVLLDIIMPALDGTAVIHRMRQLPKTKDVPVLIMSTRIEKEDIEEGLSSGAQDYIPKPFSMEELYARSMALMKANQT